MIRLSVIISLFNRSKLFARGLESIASQTMPRSDFELIIIDDNSTEDISKVYEPFLGRMNIRHIKYDHTKHPFYEEMNPTGKEDNWYHTQAISANIGISKAQGEILLICQPEILHNPTSFINGYNRAMNNEAVFGENYQGSQHFNQILENGVYDFDDMLKDCIESGLEYQWNHMPEQGFYENYWYIMYLPTKIARAVNGVDLKYQQGVYAEDDQFKMRVRMAGCPDVWGGRPHLQGETTPYVVGIHQSHRDESHHRQNRQSNHWNKGAERNRQLFREFCVSSYTVANENIDPWNNDLIISEEYFEIR